MLLARSLSRYRFFDLRGIPPQERIAALHSQLAAWQPFPESRFWVQWRDGCASVHACARDSLDDLPQRTVIWPEASLHVPLEKGLRLVSCVEGFEGQCWVDGLLRASQWWPTTPTIADWVSFVRASGSPSAPMPTAQSLRWQTPKNRVQPLERLGQVALAPARMLGSAVLAALLGLAAFAAHAFWDAQQAAEAAAENLRALRVKLEPVTKARGRAAHIRADLEAVVKPLWSPLPLDVLEHLARQLPKGVVLREFDLQGLECHVLLETPPDLARSELFKALESGEWFTSVTEQAGARGGIALQFRLNGLRSPAATQGVTGVARRSTDDVPSSAPVAIPPGLKK